MADIVHRSSRTIDQRAEVVHDRLLELGARLRDEAPPIPPGSQAATFLGVTGSLGIEIGDRGPNRIELRTTQGRVRGEGGIDIAARPDGRTDVAMVAIVKPQGFAANVMLGAAMASMPAMRDRIIDGIERAFDDLAVELAKPDGEWDARSWQPPGLPAR
ncbi:MAG TPA: hypothetical protein VGO64_03325 [Candidatus Limnocylindrales bacterium]|nr:hypothetical protein [Candidatus Limnocylindrales bacterium]